MVLVLFSLQGFDWMHNEDWFCLESYLGSLIRNAESWVRRFEMEFYTFYYNNTWDVASKEIGDKNTLLLFSPSFDNQT